MFHNKIEVNYIKRGAPDERGLLLLMCLEKLNELQHDSNSRKNIEKP